MPDGGIEQLFILIMLRNKHSLLIRMTAFGAVVMQFSVTIEQNHQLF